MNPPVLTEEQRARARAAALRARRERADVRAALRDGRVSVMQILESSTDAHQRMRVSDVLRSIPGIGPMRCAAILDSAGIASTKRVGGLTSHQRVRLMDLLADRVNGGSR